MYTNLVYFLRIMSLIIILNLLISELWSYTLYHKRVLSFKWNSSSVLLSVEFRVSFHHMRCQCFEYSFDLDSLWRYGTPGVEFEGKHTEEVCVLELFFLPGQVSCFSLHLYFELIFYYLECFFISVDNFYLAS